MTQFIVIHSVRPERARGDGGEDNASFGKWPWYNTSYAWWSVCDWEWMVIDSICSPGLLLWPPITQTGLWWRHHQLPSSNAGVSWSRGNPVIINPQAGFSRGAPPLNPPTDVTMAERKQPAAANPLIPNSRSTMRPNPSLGSNLLPFPPSAPHSQPGPRQRRPTVRHNVGTKAVYRGSVPTSPVKQSRFVSGQNGCWLKGFWARRRLNEGSVHTSN